jgi:hypothetical protein
MYTMKTETHYYVLNVNIPDKNMLYKGLDYTGLHS